MGNRGTTNCALLFFFALAACGSDSMDDDGSNGDEPPMTDTDPDDDQNPDDDNPAVNPSCSFAATGQFNPEIECRWDDPEPGDPYLALDDAVATPVVANLTDDDGNGVVDLSDTPDIVFISYQRQSEGCPDIAGVTGELCDYQGTGVLRAVSGSCSPADPTLAQHWVVGPIEIAEMSKDFPGGPYKNIWFDNSSSAALGDIDNDGSIDIVAMIRGGGAAAFERDGTLKWINLEHPSGVDYLDAAQPAIANVLPEPLAANDFPEVIVGRVVLAGESGERIWGGTAGIGTNGFLGPVSAISDVDLDGTLNILAGDTIYTAQDTDTQNTGIDHQWTYATAITDTICKHSGFACDGYTAAGNFDTDDEGEVAVVRAGTMYLFNHDGTPMLVNGEAVEIAIPDDGLCKNPNEGGPPTIADFDGDGQAELAAAGSEYYIVADLECLADPLPGFCARPGIRWEIRNEDCSSRVTGSSVFDFDGDGAAEVIYNDETTFRILDGRDGKERLQLPNISHTRLEMPVVVDSDNDGNAEIIFVENARYKSDPADTSSGLRVWGDATDSWVATRRIWNQHSYHVTNVGELGEIPAEEPVNWLTPTRNTVAGVFNNFRQNLPEFDVFSAPDLSVELAIDAGVCGMTAEVCNVGDANVGVGAKVAFFDNSNQQPIACDGGEATTQTTLEPGDCETVRCVLSAQNGYTLDVRACVDNDGYGCDQPLASGGNNECDETNNLADASGMLDCVVVE